MNILISGASGLVGTALSDYLSQLGHKVYSLSRQSKPPQSNAELFHWQPEHNSIHLNADTTIDAVINLNGVNIGDKYWTAKRKHHIMQSRIQSTALLASTLSQLSTPPKVFINASAIGFYGDTGANPVDENSPHGNNFLSDIVMPWEAAAQPAIDAGIRTVFIRSGVILSQGGGALAKMLPAFKFGLGGKIGSGQQYTSWISLLDEVRAIEFILNNHSISGPVNLTAPNAITNEVFTHALGHALKRPTILPMPALMVSLLFGEMGRLLLLGSARVTPSVLLNAGFKFKHEEIDSALDYALTQDSY